MVLDDPSGAEITLAQTLWYNALRRQISISRACLLDLLAGEAETGESISRFLAQYAQVHCIGRGRAIWRMLIFLIAQNNVHYAIQSQYFIYPSFSYLHYYCLCTRHYPTVTSETQSPSTSSLSTQGED
jgi:hypothetical protein